MAEAPVSEAFDKDGVLNKRVGSSQVCDTHCYWALVITPTTAQTTQCKPHAPKHARLLTWKRHAYLHVHNHTFVVIFRFIKGKRKFGQKKWNLVYVVLIGGSLHYYKDPEVCDTFTSHKRTNSHDNKQKRKESKQYERT